MIKKICKSLKKDRYLKKLLAKKKLKKKFGMDKKTNSIRYLSIK